MDTLSHVTFLSPTLTQWIARAILLIIGVVWLILGSYVFGGIVLGVALVLIAIPLIAAARRGGRTRT